MTIQLAPELEAEVERLATERGVDPSDFVNELVAGTVAWRKPREQKEDISVFFDRLEAISRHIPVLQTETFSRDMIYADDDIVL